MMGPFPCVGDCVSDTQRFSLAFIEALPIRDGDLAIWHMPQLEAGEQYACKWLVADSHGEFWLACKYFAVRYRQDFHKPIARVVTIVSGDEGTFEPELAERLMNEMIELRANPPQRDDVIVFPDDLLTHAAIVAAIDGRHQAH